MKTLKIFGLFVAIAVFFNSCSNDSDNAQGENGRLSVRLTDAPFPFDLVAEANVTVFRLEARRIDNLNEAEDEMQDEDSGSPFITLMEEEISVNLLDLTNGTTETLADLEVPQGTYDLIRVYVKGVNVVLTDGRTFDLKVPSGEQTGIKIFVKPGVTVDGGLSADLLLDFDVSRSFVAKGSIKKVDGIKGFNFKPVIKASNLSTAGSLKGKIITIEEEMEIALEGAQISILAADTLNTSGFTDIDGNYTIMGLEAGTYKALAELEGYLASDTVAVTIVAANKTVQDFMLEKDASEETDDTEGN